MIKLEKSEYEIARNLFKEIHWELSADAVLDGNNPGIVYVDSKENPESGFMITPEGYLLCGNPSNNDFNKKLNKWFMEDWIPTAIKNEWEEFEFYFQRKWEDTVVNKIIPDRIPIKYPRKHYKLTELKYKNYKQVIADGFEIVPVNADFLETDFKNIDHVTNWVDNNWGDVDNFEKLGFGFCIIHEDTIVSWCIGDCISGDRCEMGIHTDPKYRRKGFAAAVVGATVEYCLNSGFKEIGWQCAEDNIGSQKTAGKVGFEENYEYYGYSGCFEKIEHLLNWGFYTLYNLKQFDIAEKYFEEAFKIEKPNAWIYFSIAIGYALAGRKETAMNNLITAVKFNVIPIEKIKDTPALQILHDLPEWNNLIN